MLLILKSVSGGYVMATTIFISGIHGVGKTTLCNKITNHLGFRHYSCSDLIKQNSDYVETSKKIDNASRNQEVLLKAIENIKDKVYLLDGHFCLIDKLENVIQLDQSVFKSIAPKAIVNICCDTSIIRERLINRDGKALSLTKLNELQSAEKTVSAEVAETLNIPYFVYTSSEPVDELITLLKQITL
ncbi:AAA family ATPase [Photobacterium damselae subsp. damselae]|nr:AAA family ATPase [Photobacterium damselae subsp. damselae]